MASETKFTWIPSYTAIASKLIDMRDQEERLLEICKRHTPMPGVTRMDPFSLMALFNRQIADATRIAIIEDILDDFDIDEQPPQDFTGIPVVNNLKWRFMDDVDSHFDEKWDFFEEAVRYSKGEKDYAKFSNLFDKVLEQKNIALPKLTIGLYWCFPNTFLPLDSNTTTYIHDAYFFTYDSKHFNGSEYLNLLENIHEQVGLPFTEISADAYIYDGWGPLPNVFDPGINTELWGDLLQDKEIFTDPSLDMLAKMLQLGGQATCKELENEFHEPANRYNGIGTALGQRIAKRLNIESRINQWGGSQYWSVPFLGKEAEKNQPGTFVWKIRPELKEAMEANPEVIKITTMPADKTSKTPPKQEKKSAGSSTTEESANGWWLTAKPSIWSFSGINVGEEQNYTLHNENGNPRRIFKNFLEAKPGDIVLGYEATPVKKIVAICEISREHDDERMYFRKVRDLNEPIPYETIKEYDELSSLEFIKNPNGSFFRVSPEELGFIMSLIPEEDDVDDAKPQAANIPPYTDEDFLAEVYMQEEDFHALKRLAQEKRNVILQGAPGTGKTYTAERLAWAIMGCKDNSRVQKVQFHQNTSYDEFVIGFRPNAQGGFYIQEGPFLSFCDKAAKDSDKDYFFIIDEINRANISKVFGELLMLIETSHRGESLRLGIDGRMFSVPENVIIIGMMNTADRGLALIDYALRRRFAFFEMKPALNNEAFKERVTACDDTRMPALIDAVQKLNQKITDDPALGDGFCIAHSYFCKSKEQEPGCVKQIIEYELVPLVKEYWFDDRKTADEEIQKLKDVL